MLLVFKKKKNSYIALKTINTNFSKQNRPISSLTSHNFVVDQEKKTLICRSLK